MRKQAAIASGNRLTAYVWYDNEVGYSCQVLRIAEQMCGVSYQKFLLKQMHNLLK